MSPQWIVVIVLIAVVYFIFIKKKPQVQNKNQDAKKRDEIQSDEMVECSACKIYCSLEDALLSNGKYYCSKECLEKRK
ncbi:PP0621 family protein [Sulfurimonas sp.]|uniref:PP0621 family protein n=1 Tax=Sulfurimonas sp. TaxID=2022749 RepID=UPI0025ED6118|nr:PP0621 family protein [Sulfurimonas sp.]MBW6487730.1 hypothetical protein [Sulfurimonas sp.]